MMTFQNLNRKTHIYLGLFFLLFVWLFALSGLILNHGNWKFTSFWEEREETTEEFQLPESSMNSISEQTILNYFQLTGEVRIQKQTPELLEIRIESPGIVNDIHIDLPHGKGTRKQLKYNAWGKLRGLHTFNGVNKDQPSDSPNWWITATWRFAMDIVAIGLIIICITSWIMWFKVRNEFKLGYATVVISFLFAGYFVFLGIF